MALSQQQQNLQFQHQLQNQQQQHSHPFRNLYQDGQISPPVAYFNGSNLPDQSQHPPYIPPFHVVGFAPAPVDGSDGGVELPWNYGGGEANKNKRLKEQDFLENNSQISSVDFLQARSVSTGLGLSLDNGRLASSGDSAFHGLARDEIERELQRQDEEIERFLKVQSERLRQEVMEKVQADQHRTISYVEGKFLGKLRQMDAELENINKKNLELETQMEQFAAEATAWQQRAKYNESLINTLQLNLHQVYAQTRESKEGCGDSEVDDTASCCNGRAIDFHLLCKENNKRKATMPCKVCNVNEICMLLLPCKHLCLCKECESELGLCPLCQSSKVMGLEVFM